MDVGDAAPATLLVAELLDSGLLGEQFIPALHDAHARGWLSVQPPCRVVPSRARVTAQLIESPYLAATCRLDAQRLGYQLPDGCEDGAAWRKPLGVPSELLEDCAPSSPYARAVANDRDARGEGSELPGGAECAICQAPIKPQDIVRLLGCRHVFHAGCIDPWLDRSTRCPTCRADVLH